MGDIELEMNYKTIAVRRKLPEYIKLIINKTKDYGFISGSCARYYATSKDIKDVAIYSDIDIFCFNEEYYNNIINILIDVGSIFKKDTVNASQYLYKNKKQDIIIEVIKPFKNEWMQTYGTQYEVIDQFDFTVVKAAFLSEHEMVVHIDFDSNNLDKKLVITHINCPIAVSLRVAKYIKKGYKIKLREIYKLFQEWDGRDIKYKEKFNELLSREQLNPDEIMDLERLLRWD